MKKPKSKKKASRVTISLARVVFKWAGQMMKAKGFNDNFSAYVGDLIRRDGEQRASRNGACK